MEFLRTYKQQFSNEDVKKIEEIFVLLENLKEHKDFSRFHCVEIKCSLVGGSILGALLISFSIMEMVILENYVYRHLGGSGSMYSKAIEGLESNKIHIYKIIDESVKFSFISANDAELFKKIYKEYRIPLSHGLRTKGMYDNSEIKELFGHDFETFLVSSRDMEDSISEHGLDLIKQIILLLLK